MNDINYPYDERMEKAVLGALLIDHEAIFKISDTLEPPDFYFEKHKLIYNAIMEMFKAGRDIELLTVGQELDTQKTTEKIGGYAYLADLINHVVSSSNVQRYAEIVKGHSIRRQLITAQYQNFSIIADEEKDISAVLAETQGNLIKINAITQTNDSIKAIISELDEVQDEYSIKYQNGQKYIGYQSGIEKIDQHIDGIRPGHIWVVGGWTSTGKTQFALNIVHSLLQQNVPTAIVSLEMSRVDTLARLIGIRTNISSMAVIKGKNDLQTAHRIEEAKDFFSRAPLYVHTTFFDIEKIKMLIRKDVYTLGVKFVVVDYVQNIISEKAMREYDILTQSAVSLQAIARELGITIYIVSQISNESEKGNGAGAGFKGTGALEAVADLAIRLERDRKKEGADDEFVPVKITIFKNRHGFTGKIEDYCMWLKSGKYEAGLPYIPVEARGGKYVM